MRKDTMSITCISGSLEKDEEAKVYKAQLAFVADRKYTPNKIYSGIENELKGKEPLMYPYKLEHAVKDKWVIHICIPLGCTREQLYVALNINDVPESPGISYKEDMGGKEYTAKHPSGDVGIYYTTYALVEEEGAIDNPDEIVFGIALVQHEPIEHPKNVQAYMIRETTKDCAKLRFVDYEYNKQRGTWEYLFAVEEGETLTVEEYYRDIAKYPLKLTETLDRVNNKPRLYLV